MNTVFWKAKIFSDFNDQLRDSEKPLNMFKFLAEHPLKPRIHLRREDIESLLDIMALAKMMDPAIKQRKQKEQSHKMDDVLRTISEKFEMENFIEEMKKEISDEILHDEIKRAEQETGQELSDEEFIMIELYQGMEDFLHLSKKDFGIEAMEQVIDNIIKKDRNQARTYAAIIEAELSLMEGRFQELPGLDPMLIMKHLAGKTTKEEVEKIEQKIKEENKHGGSQTQAELDMLQEFIESGKINLDELKKDFE